MRLVSIQRDALVVPSLVGFGVELGLVRHCCIVLGLDALCYDLCHVETDIGAGEATFPRLGRVVPAGVARATEEVDIVAGTHTDGFHERGRQSLVELLLCFDILRLPDSIWDLLHRCLHRVRDGWAEVFPQHSIPSIGREVTTASYRFVGRAVVLVAEFSELGKSFLALVELPQRIHLDHHRGVVLGNGFDWGGLVAQALHAAVGDDEVARSTRDVLRDFAVGIHMGTLVWVDRGVDLGVVPVLSVTDDPPAHAGGSRSASTSRQRSATGHRNGDDDSNLHDALFHFSP